MSNIAILTRLGLFDDAVVPAGAFGSTQTDGSILATLFVHFIMFGVLGALVAYHVYRAKTGHPALLGVTLASLVGILAGIATEMYQLQVPARETSFEGTNSELKRAHGLGRCGWTWSQTQSARLPGGSSWFGSSLITNVR